MTNQKWQRSGFTLIEMLTIVIIIGILASITTIGFGAWRQGLARKEMQSDLSQAASLMKQSRNFATGSSGFPVYTNNASIPNFTGAKTVSVRYVTPYGSPSVAGSATNFCLQASSTVLPTVGYYVTESKGPSLGTCTGGDNAVLPLPYSSIVSPGSPSAYCEFSEAARASLSSWSSTPYGCNGISGTLNDSSPWSWNTQEPGISSVSSAVRFTDNNGAYTMSSSGATDAVKPYNLNAWSVEAWVKFAEAPYTNIPIAALQGHWGLRTTTNGFRCDFAGTQSGSTQLFTASNTTTSLNQTNWYHVACTFGANQLKLYVNGSEVSSVTAYANTSNNGGGNMILGQNDGSGPGPDLGSARFDGWLDEFAFYKNKTLSPSEVLQRYQYVYP